MTEIRILRHADRVVRLWKNGGGFTEEVAIFPPNSALDDFCWRASIAMISSAGSFSTFADVERIMCVLSGQLHISIEDAPTQAIDALTPPIKFAGTDHVVAKPGGKPAFVFNLMVRGDSVFADLLSHVVVREALEGDVLIIAYERTRVMLGGEPVDLDEYDALYGSLMKGTRMVCDRPVIVAALSSPAQVS